MKPMPLSEIAALCGAAPPRQGGDILIGRVSKDTRTLEPGDLYIALRGASFDGNQFAAQAAARGAAAVVLDDPEAPVPPGLPALIVPDGLGALHRLAAAWRARLRARVVCLTGSNGKTTTKDFLAAVLATRFATSATAGNLNNFVGLPLSILEASEADEACVWEVAMNHPGEIAPLAALARPDVGIITNIGVAHIEFLGSQEAIAQEKGCLFEALGAGGLAIVPDQCPFAESLLGRTTAPFERVGGPASAVRAEGIILEGAGCRFTLVAGGERLPARLPVPGAHMVSNALLAVAAGLAFGLTPGDCVRGLAAAAVTGGRLARRMVGEVCFLDDSYNANPDSVEAALRVLAAMPGARRHIAVLGVMGELGAYEAEGYRRAGTAAAACADVLIVVGDAAALMADAAVAAGLEAVHRVSTPAEAAAMLKTLAEPGDLVLVKGSRSGRMEGVIENYRCCIT